MNILYIADAIPSGRLIGNQCFSVGYSAIRALAGCGNKVTLIAFSDLSEGDLKNKAQMERFCEEVILVRSGKRSRLSGRFLRIYRFLKNAYPKDFGPHVPEMKAKLRELDRRFGFDLAIYGSFWLAQYAGEMKRLPKILYLMDSETLSIKEMLKSAVLDPFNRLELSRMIDRIKNFEKDTYRDFSKIIVVSGKDRDEIMRLDAGLDVDILPLSVDADYFRKGPLEGGGDILFMGILWAEHNADAAYYFCREIFPIIRRRNKKASFVLAGGGLRPAIKKAALMYPPVELPGFLDDVRSSFDRAAVFVLPMRIGSGMNNKLLEAMSMSKAIVTTSHGNREVGLRNGLEAVITDSKEEFASAVIDLLEDKKRSEFIGANARKKAEACFSVDIYAHQLKKIIEDTLSLKV